MIARSFGFLPRQAMFSLGLDVDNILGKRTKMKLFKNYSINYFSLDIILQYNQYKNTVSTKAKTRIPKDNPTIITAWIFF